MESSNGHFSNEGYELEDRITCDSWGELFRAEYHSHRRTVLFRKFAEELSQSATWELTAAEIQAWARVDHPGILQPLDWDNCAAGPFLAMAMPDGQPLATFLRQREGLREPAPGLVFASLVEAVEAARLFGVLHLGLSPTNIWVSEDGAVQVSDFGLWYVSSEFPRVPAPSTLFLAPEQLAGGKASAATDVYALGLVAVALYNGLEAVELATRREYGSIPWLDDSTGEMAMRCLVADPLGRPRSAAELLAGGPDPHDSTAGAYRDCPVCKLKAQIARDLGLRRRTVLDRLRDMDSEPSPAAQAGCETRREQEVIPDADVMSTGSSARMFAWVAIASLMVMTALVWWLAFR